MGADCNKGLKGEERLKGNISPPCQKWSIGLTGLKRDAEVQELQGSLGQMDALNKTRQNEKQNKM